MTKGQDFYFTDSRSPERKVTLRRFIALNGVIVGF
ncbi:hypothetical protein EV682_11677 [Iodobacter fluviatilis]|uniref:Uncharacterized protein n=1 Tax=Iodobacter fluviatilis TaxID=537 RepID=A0A377SUY8_9NEIS|nr:hypothetical protein EV682_11677 [Iodobacter fluviatilis]STR45138.1 Uncharacterised protein [Iodobacter fluviatilis]